VAFKGRFLRNEPEIDAEMGRWGDRSKRKKLSPRPRVPASPCLPSLESKKPPTFLLALGLSSASFLIKTPALTQEISLPETPTNFTGNPPILLKVTAPYTTVNILLTRYYFTLKLPANSVQSLGQVTIKQGENPEAIAFKLSDTQAFEGTQDNKGQLLTLKEVNEDPPKKTIAVSFEPPVPPGTTLTISLLAKKNPFFSGVYLFRVC
jgi:hypothetical protein